MYKVYTCIKPVISEYIQTVIQSGFNLLYIDAGILQSLIDVGTTKSRWYNFMMWLIYKLSSLLLIIRMDNSNDEFLIAFYYLIFIL